MRTLTLTRRLAVTLAVAGAALAAAGPAAAQTPAPAACPATFQVLHDDRIGALSLPAGPYAVTVTDPARLSCAAAADHFRRFLEAWDGRLPAPWRLDAATATFSGGPGVGFSVARTDVPSGGGGGQHPASGLRCPGTFQVLHDDRIGTFRIPAGRYGITLLATEPLTCAQAATRFAAFLQDFDGRLPAPWALVPASGTFLRLDTGAGFRVERSAAASPSTGGGSGAHPAGGATRCPGTFRVLHDDRIGALRVPAGRYAITPGSSGPSCDLAARFLTRFLRDGTVSAGWKLNRSTATFANGRLAFRIKRAG